MDDGQELFCHLWVTTLSDGLMVIATALQSRVAAPVVCDDQRARLDCVFDEAAKDFGAAIGSDRQSKPSSITTISPVVLRGARFPVPDFDGSDHQRLVMNTPAFTTSSSANPRFVDLNMLASVPTDPILIATHHGGAQLVKQAKSRFVAAQTKLSLKLDGGHAGGLARNQPSRPEPYMQGHMAALHRRPDSQAGIFATGATTQNSGTVRKPERLARNAAMRAGEAVTPAGFLKPASARRIVREETLKLRQRPRKRKAGSGMNVHAPNLILSLRGCKTDNLSNQHLVGVGEKRIGTVRL